MKLILLTQDDPFYLPDSINDFILKINHETSHEIACVIVSAPSVYGKSEGFIQKTYKTYKIFGFSFFLHYSLNIFIIDFFSGKVF